MAGVEKGFKPPSPEEMMRMADQAYEHPRFEDSVPFTQVPNGTPVKVKDRKCIVLDRVNDRSTGLDAYLITDEKRSFAVMAIRGTELEFGNPDVGADIEFWAGHVPKQARLAGTIYDEWRKKYKKIDKWGVTGHSLGGIDVQYVMATHGDRVDWAYNFCGPNLYPLLSSGQQEMLRRNGEKLQHLGGKSDPLFNARSQAVGGGWQRDYAGFLAHMDMDPANHDIGPQFEFDADGNPKLKGGSHHRMEFLMKQLFVREFGAGGAAAAHKIKLEYPEMLSLLGEQLRLQKHIDTVRRHNSRIVSDMEAGFNEVFRRFASMNEVDEEDVRQVVNEFRLAPADNVDFTAVDRVNKNMVELGEKNHGLVRTAMKVINGTLEVDEQCAGRFKKLS